MVLGRLMGKRSEGEQPGPGAAGPGPGRWRPGDPPVARVDRLAGDSVAAEWVARLKDGRSEGLREFLVSQPDVQRRDFYVSVIADAFRANTPSWLEKWVAQEPNDPIRIWFRGAHRLRWAWEVRGSGRAKTVSTDTFKSFHDILRLAQQDVERAIQLAPHDHGPWVELLTIARGLGFPLEDHFGIYNEIQLRCLWHEYAHLQMLQSLAPKWYGSRSLMFDWARSVAKEAPEGHGVHSVLAEAHVEAWLDEGSALYWKQPGVDEDVMAAAERSVLSDAFYSPNPPAIHSTFAYCFWRIENRERFWAEVKAMNGLLAGPWRYSPTPEDLFLDVARDMGRTPLYDAGTNAVGPTELPVVW